MTDDSVPHELLSIGSIAAFLSWNGFVALGLPSHSAMDELVQSLILWGTLIWTVLRVIKAASEMIEKRRKNQTDEVSQ